MHYDKTRRILYVYDEVYGVQISNRRLKEMINHKVMIIADSAEPKSIAEMKSYGIKIKGAKKGPGSVEYGEKWLDDLEAIIIDPIRCPNTAREFESADYDVDRNGNMKNRIVDKDNHTIDMMRYALEEEMKSKIGFGFLK
jgi:phage terminase large subunit